MVIDPNSISNSVNLGKGKAAVGERAHDAKTASVTKKASSAPDSVSLSQEAQSITKLEASVANASDVNNERIAEIKVALQSGRYSIDSSAIAEKMLNEDA